MKKEDIKEIMEVLEAGQLVSVSCVKVFKDGKVNFDDLPVVFDLLKQFKVIMDAIEGIKEIPSEIQDIDEREAARIGLKVYQIMAAIKKEYKTK